MEENNTHNDLSANEALNGSIINILNNKIIKEEDGYHYICPKCHKFPFIEFIKSIKYVKFTCSCYNTKQILIKDLFDKTKNYITINGLSNSGLSSPFSIDIDKNYEGFKCKEHNKKFKHFCLTCHLNICPECPIEEHRMMNFDFDIGLNFGNKKNLKKNKFLDIITGEREENEEKDSQEEEDYSNKDEELTENYQNHSISDNDANIHAAKYLFVCIFASPMYPVVPTVRQGPIPWWCGGLRGMVRHHARDFRPERLLSLVGPVG